MTATRRPLIEAFRTSFSPLELFEFFRPAPGCFWLDSSMDTQKLGRFSFMGSRPFLTLQSRGRRVTATTVANKTDFHGNPFEILGKYLESYRLEIPDALVPFTGGAVGFLSYDLCHQVEKLPKNAVNDLKLPEMLFGFYDVILAYDNLEKTCCLISTGFPETDETNRLKQANARLQEMKRQLADFKPSSPRPTVARKPAVIRGNFPHADYVAAVARARQYIIDGDIFEVNLSQRFETELAVPPYELYRRLRAVNPAPFAAYLDFGKLKIVSTSPERFLKVTGRRVETRPIKGTIKRGKTPDEDARQATILSRSIKDHAENMMIVDLERNDLGRVCLYGTVKVTELAILETFPTVFHLTSTVVGELRAEKNMVDLLKATFPGGSITGAPKIRAMEIIDELEPTRRSVYTGSLGYFSFNGNADINIVIRTFIIKGNRAYFQVGGAVVYDSDPEAEYQETLLKGKALLTALGVNG